MKIVFMGTPDFAVPGLKELAGAGHEIRGVVTQPDRPRGRGRKLAPPPVKEEALALGIPVFQPGMVRDADFVRQLKELKPDIIAVIAYGRLLPEEILELPRFGCVNVHSSLLPRYRGAAPIQRAIMSGERVTGVTIMKMNSGLDSGDILLQSGIEIAGEDNFGTVHDRLSRLGAELLLEALDLIEAGKLAGLPQDHDRATYAPAISREDEIINWTGSAVSIRNQVRGLDPWPGARTTLGEKILKIWRTSELDSVIPGRAGERAVPGQVLGVAGGGLAVQCGDAPLLVRELQLQGGKRLGAEELLRGFKINSGAVLGSL